MNEIEKLRLDGEIPMNCYVLARNNECFIIDPGYQKELIQEYVDSKGYTVKGILLTHAHIDHIEALDCYDVPVYLHEKEYEILIDNYNNGFEFFGKLPNYSFESLDIRLVNEDSELNIGGEKIEIILTPGHTIGSVCYVIGHDIYSGDTLFEATVGKWDRPTGNVEELRVSVLKLINTQPDYMLVHPGHGRSTTIGVEKQINPFYIKWSQEELYSHLEK
ncbi:MBL fold metallo-hydrolase [Aureibacter tunicatorum]|uniref:Glyoxylase-like metal-dependent hydrolase (Beta-lactamase superfamily II) n=1 Tax=Aureibacter tunicatorum TaxID=866807 RepID=A0AAE3XRT6_9BACT|nr:MBL fold metallo-hydrolase [Aureibacter tunicatorum]MDR6241447.1 glyoxylase-like metal-dependent hydrolase (beta-lactamase superfamily II) [Aureibacter tunicatorum]